MWFVGGRGVAPTGDTPRDVVGPGQAAARPLLERGDHGGWQPAVGGHLQVAVLADDLHDQGVARRSRHGHARGGGEVGPRVAGETPLGVAGCPRMARCAAGDEERSDLGFEELEVFGL